MASLFSLFPPKFGTPSSSTDLDNWCRQFSLAYSANIDIQEKNLGPTILLCLMDDEKSKWLAEQFDVKSAKVEEMLIAVLNRYSIRKPVTTLEELSKVTIKTYTIPAIEEYWTKLMSIKDQLKPGFYTQLAVQIKRDYPVLLL